MLPLFQKITRIVLLSYVFCALSSSLFAQEESAIIPLKFKVKFNSEESKSLSLFETSAIEYSKSGTVVTGLESLDALNETYQITNMKRVFPYAGKFEERHRKFGLHLWYELEMVSTSKQSVSNCISAYIKNNHIEFSEPYYEKRLVGEDEFSVISDTVNDPMFDQQWHYNNDGQTNGTVGADISLIEAWQIESGSDEVIVAVIDGGVDYTHVDLADAMWNNVAELNGTAGVDDDGNGYIDDIHGYGFGDGIGEYNPHNHGTHVGGTIGAISNNGIGVAGIAGGNDSTPGVQLMSCAVFGSSGNDGFDVAFVYAADNGAVISQNSWGYTSAGYYDQSVLDAIDYFIANAGYDADGLPFGPMQGGLVVFAAGNDYSDGLYYPGYYEPILTVSAINHNNEKSYYSNYGDWVDIAATGGETNSSTAEGVLSTLPSNSYGFYQGTSMACPHVSGVAALIVSKYGGNGLTAEIVKQRLLNTTDDVDASNPGYVGKLGSGKLNAYQALIDDDGVPPNAINDLVSIDIGMTSVTLQWTATGFSADSGAATAYDIRYADYEITAANFESADRVQYAPTPSISGTSQTYEVSGLSSQKSYWFAIKANDYFGNTSDISNILNITTEDAPIISINPNYIVHSMDSGMENVVTAEIINTGAIDLEFTLPAFMQVSNTMVNKTDLIDFDYTPKKGQIDTREGYPVLTGSGEDSGSGYSWKDNKDGAGPAFDWIDIDSIGTSLTIYGDDVYQLVSLPFDFPFYDSTRNQVCISTNALLVFNSANATRYGNYQIPTSYTPNDFIAVLWDDLRTSSYDAIKYYGDVDKFIVQYNNVSALSGSYYYTMQAILYANGNIKLQYLDVDENYSSTIGIENDLGDDGLQIAFNTSYIQDSLSILISQQPDFISSVNPSSGIVAAGSSQFIDITLNSSDLDPDNYESEIVINSNDPLNPVVSLPIQLHVNGMPSYTVNIDSLFYDSVFVNTTDSLVVVIENTGSDTLHVSNAYFENLGFELEPGLNDFKIYKGEQKQFYVYFSPTNNIDFVDTLVLENNSLLGDVRIGLKGIGLNPPVLTVSPSEFVYNGMVGDTIPDYFTVGNLTGGSNLFYNVSEVIYIDNTELTDQKFTLPAQTISVSDDDAIVVSTSRVVNEIVFNTTSDLTGKNIGFYSDSRSVIAADLIARGANIIVINEEITSLVLDTIDVFVIDDDIADQSSTELQVINDFVMQGGSLLSEGDNSGSIESIQVMIEGSGIEAIAIGDFSDYLITDFSSHPINENINSIYSFAAGLYFNTTGNAIELAYTDGGDCHVAVSSIGAGKIIVAGNEICSDYFTSDNYDNRAFVNNALDWLCGSNSSSGWLSILQDVDTLSVGSESDVSFSVETGDLIGGNYEAKIITQSNDPFNTFDTVTVNLSLTGIPEIELNIDSLYYDTIFTYTSDSLPLIVRNTGTDSLFVSNTYVQDGLFYLESGFSEFNLPVGEEQLFYVHFTPTADIAYFDTLVLESNTLEGDIRIPLLGNGLYPPVFASSPDSIDIVINAGDSVATPVTINNTAGASDLVFNISIEGSNSLSITNSKIGFYADESRIPSSSFVLPFDEKSISPNDLGDIVKEYNNFPSSNTGVIVIGDIAYVVDWATDLLYEFSLSGDAIVGSFAIHAGAFGIAYDGSYLWIGDYAGNVYGYDFSGNQIGSFSCPYIGYNGITFNGEYFETCAVFTSNPTFSTVDYDNTVISSVASNLLDVNQIAKGGNYLYAICDTYTILELDIINSEVITIDTIPFYEDSGSNIYSIYVTSNKIWLGSWDGILYELEGKSNKWLSMESYSGIIASGESVDVNAIINAEELMAGFYDASISVTSNDPTHNGTSIPVHIEVNGIPKMAINTDSLSFDTCYVGVLKSQTIAIENSGTDTLKITDISSSSFEFIVDTTQLVLVPNQSHVISITYSPTTEEPDQAQLSIISNDPTQLTKNISLFGLALNPPVLSVQQDSIVVELYSGDSIISVLNFDNTLGGDDLLVDFSIDYLAADSLQSKKLSCNQQLFNKVSMAESKGTDSVLVIQDSYSWGTFSMQSFLQSNFGINPYVIQASSLSACNLSAFQLVFICSAQGSSYYNYINSDSSSLTAYVESGGKIVYQAATFSTDVDLPGGYSLANGNQSNYNTNVYTEHDILKNVDSLMYGYYANLNYLASFPNDAEILTTITGGSIPTSIAYKLGAGEVVATGMAWEYYYSQDTNYFNMMWNTVEYMLNLSGSKGWLYTPEKNYQLAADSLGEVPVTVSAEGLSQGIYSANINISSNDPFNTSKTIPVKLTVNDAANIKVSESLLSFEDVFVGDTAIKKLSIENIGSIDLQINDMMFDNVAFNSNLISVLLSPGESIDFNVIFTPNTSETYNTSVKIYSNSHFNSVYEVKLLGEALVPPVLNTGDESISAYANPGSITTKDFVIDNFLGGSDLKFTIETGFDESMNSTSTQYFYTSGATTNHYFDNLSKECDSLKFIVTINGDFDSSFEYAVLTIDSLYLGRINETGVDLAVDYTREFVFYGDTALQFLYDGMIDVVITNSYDVSSYGEAKHQVQLITYSTSWLSSSIVADTLSVGDSVLSTLSFDASNLSAGDYSTQLRITSNDPVEEVKIIPVSLKVADNVPPEVVKPIYKQSVYIGQNNLVIDVSTVFVDKDNDDLILFVTSSDAGVGVASISDSTLTLQALSVGQTEIKIMAYDGVNLPILTSFVFEVLRNTTGIVNPLLNGVIYDISIYPNPVKDNMNVTFELENSSKVEMMLFTFDGKLVEYIDLGIQGQGQLHHTLDLKELNQGIFVFKLLIDGELSGMEKIIKE